MFSEYLSIGEVLKPQGVHGQVKVRPDTNDPARFSQLQQVYIQQDNAYIAWPVSDVSVRDGYVYCTLNHAQTRDDAEKQRGAMLYIDREHAVPLAENEYYISDLIGCTVQDQQGQAIGTLADVLQPGANDVYEIKTPKGMMYLAALPFVIEHVDAKAGVIVVDETRLPEVAVFED